MKGDNQLKGNAFKILMASASKNKLRKSPARRSSPGVKRKTPASSVVDLFCGKEEESAATTNTSTNRSNFVLCPICGTHVLTSTINIHLDQCTSKRPTSASGDCSKIEEELSLLNKKKRALINNDEFATTTTTQNEVNTVTKQKAITPNDHSDEVETQMHSLSSSGKDTKTGESTCSVNEDTCGSTSASKINIFSHMMHNSRRFNKNLKPKRHRFHLHDKYGKVSWACDADNTSDELGRQEQWKSSVYVKGVIYGEKDELIISSSIPSYVQGGWRDTKVNDLDHAINTPKPLVLKPSKLSVPVLKSCLQKAIRRKRPLPACRCAMELMDKSFGDFIRRLPIIILEDSSLHPDFPFLIWLMIAASKDFVPTPSITSKIMSIVFEVASCSWKDDLDDISTSVDQDLKSTPEQFDINLESDRNSLDERETLMLRSFILRKHYGGMTCDMKMIDGYIFKWRERFYNGVVDDQIATRCFKDMKVKWIEVPSLLHKDSVQQSSTLVPPLVLGTKPVTALAMNDVSISGIDFHCSNVLDNILEDKAFYNCLLKKISSDNSSTTALIHGIDGAVSKESLKNFLKGLTWTFSSGVNVRRSLYGNKKKSLSQLAMYELWSHDVKPHVESFATKYISSRLSKY